MRAAFRWRDHREPRAQWHFACADRMRGMVNGDAEEGCGLEYIENKVFLKKHGDRGRDKKDMKEWVLAGKPGPSSSGAGWKLPALGQAQRWQHRRCERPEAEARGWPERRGRVSESA